MTSDQLGLRVIIGRSSKIINTNTKPSREVARSQLHHVQPMRPIKKLLLRKKDLPSHSLIEEGNIANPDHDVALCVLR